MDPLKRTVSLPSFTCNTRTSVADQFRRSMTSCKVSRRPKQIQVDEKTEPQRTDLNSPFISSPAVNLDAHSSFTFSMTANRSESPGCKVTSPGCTQYIDLPIKCTLASPIEISTVNRHATATLTNRLIRSERLEPNASWYPTSVTHVDISDIGASIPFTNEHRALRNRVRNVDELT